MVKIASSLALTALLIASGQAQGHGESAPSPPPSGSISGVKPSGSPPSQASAIAHLTGQGGSHPPPSLSGSPTFGSPPSGAAPSGSPPSGSHLKREEPSFTGGPSPSGHPGSDLPHPSGDFSFKSQGGAAPSGAHGTGMPSGSKHGKGPKPTGEPSGFLTSTISGA